MPLRRDGLQPFLSRPEHRTEAPIRRLARAFGMNVWLVTGYAESQAVLSDSVRFSNDIRGVLGGQRIGGLGFTDPPDHTRLRKFLTPEFTGRRLARLAPRIEQIVAERLDALAVTAADAAATGPGNAGVVDLAAEFSFPIPYLVICELLGLSEAERDAFAAFGHARFDLTGGASGTFDAVDEANDFLLQVVARQRVRPGPGLIGAILREHGDEIDDAELAGLADGVFTGGYETSASMLSLGTVALLRDRDAYRRAGDDDSIDAIVDELLRYLAVVQIAFPRFARADMELFGARIKAGDVVVPSLTAANRDARFGADPDRFDPDRDGPTHLAFGYGMHRCVGSELARMELRAAFRALSRRYPDLALAVAPGDLEFRDLSLVYGVKTLPVRLNAGRPDAVQAEPLGSVVESTRADADGAVAVDADAEVGPQAHGRRPGCLHGSI